jgi:hypothetical protein
LLKEVEHLQGQIEQKQQQIQQNSKKRHQGQQLLSAQAQHLIFEETFVLFT